MLLRQLIQNPSNCSKLLVRDPFRELDQEELVKEVIGLANADVDGLRHILFGINAGAMEGSGIVGITESAMADLKKAHRLISALIEPIIHLAFIFDTVDNKLVGALEIDGCDEGPYAVGQDFSEELSRGKAWIREGRELRPIDAAELVPISMPAPIKAAKPPPIEVGFNDQPDCKYLEMAVPDTSDPPFANDKKSVKKNLSLKDAIKDTVGTITHRILRLGRASMQVATGDSDEGDLGSQTDVFRATVVLVGNAENHYYYEEKALELNLAVCNKGTESVEGVSIELGFPRLPDFDVADRLYVSPFDKRSSAELKNLGYPDVERHNDGILVRSTIGYLGAGEPTQAFRCALRLAVGPGMQGRKLAILYALRGKNDQSFGKGRLKIKFVKASD